FIVVSRLQMQPAAVGSEGGLHVFPAVWHKITVSRGREGPRFLVILFCQSGGRFGSRRNCCVRRRHGNRVAGREKKGNRNYDRKLHCFHPPSAIVMPTRMQPRTTIAIPT